MSVREVFSAPLPGAAPLRSAGPGSWAVLGALVALILATRVALAPYLDSLGDVIVGLAFTAAVFILARWVAHFTRAQLGFVNSLSGAVWGLGFAAAVAALGAVAVFVPSVRDLVLASAPGPASWWGALFVVPLGTVLFEEVVFRGVLWAAAARVMSTVPTLLFTSFVFALWHVPPLAFSQGAALSQVSPLVQLTATLVTTFIGGVVFGLLRAKSGSLLAPLIAHTATNSVGVAVVALAAALN